MDPTPAEIASFVDINAIADWAGLDGDPGVNTVASPRGSFFSTLGIQPTAHPRIIANIAEADFIAIVAAWRLHVPADDGTAEANIPPTPAQASQAGLLGRASRILCGTQDTQAQAAAKAAAAAAAIAAAAAVPTSGSAAASGRKVKMTQVADQMCEDEHEVLDPVRVKEAYDRYQAKTGDYPAPDEELTAEQLTCLAARFRLQQPPYVDFGVWGPHGQRIQRKVKFKGVRLEADGTIGTIEINGPPTFAAWSLCYAIFKTGCVMLGEISLARLDCYSKLIQRYHDRYGSAVWAIIYQADVRARLELTERLRRRAEDDFDRAHAAGAPHPYSRTHPWDHVWRLLCSEQSFWKEEVEEPALLVLARTGKLHEMLDNDAPIATSTGARGSSPTKRQGTPHAGTPPPSKRQQQQLARQHNIGADGMHTTNRRGVRLCHGWNAGTCTASDSNGRCSSNKQYAHQCAKCLSIEHGANSCSKEVNTPKPVSKGKGKGRGRKGGGRY